MPMTCNRYETRKFMAGHAAGLVRRYDPATGCPHQVGNEVFLTSMFVPGKEGRDVPFAKAMIISVRPGTAAEFRRLEEQARQDGYDNGEAWYQYYVNQMYPGLGDDERLYHLGMRLLEMEKNA